MSAEVSFEEAKQQIRVLPSLMPRPNTTNIRNLEIALYDRLEGIPSLQSHEHGYKGKAQQRPEYALVTNIPWVDFPNPGDHRLADGTLTAEQQCDADAVYAAARICW